MRTEAYWLAPLEAAQETRAVEAARLQIAAHEAAQAAIGADRAVGFAKRGESWRPFDVREEAPALFFGVTSLQFTGVRLSREFAAPTQIVVGSELGAAKGLRKRGVIDTATRATSFLPRAVSPTAIRAHLMRRSTPATSY